jgi:PAS domain S-box-containing protein
MSPQIKKPTQNRRSIAKGLTISLILSIMAISTLVILINYWHASNRERELLEKKADEYLSVITENLEISLWDLDRENIQNIGKFYFQNEFIDFLEVKGALGEVFFEARKNENEELIVRRGSIFHELELIGYVQIGITTRPLDARLNELLRSSFLGIVTVLAVVISLTGFLLRMYLRRPLDQLSQVVNDFANGNYQKDLSRIEFQEFEEFVKVLIAMGEKINSQLMELSLAELKYRSIFENSVEGIFQTTLGGAFLTANPAMASILGYDGPEELMETVTDVNTKLYVNPDRRKALMALLVNNDLATGFEARFYHKNGSEVYCLLNIRAVRDQNGRILRLEGFVTDNTKRVEAEKKVQIYRDHLEELVENRTKALANANMQLVKENADRKKAEAALKESEGHFRSILEDSVDPIVVFDNKGNATYTNPAFNDLFDWAHEELSGEKSPFIPESYRKEARKAFLTVLDKGKIGAFETQRFTKSGDLVDVSLSASAMKGQDGRINGVAVSLRNITESKKLESQLRQAQKMEALGTLAGGIAHDFNNILAAIMGYAEVGLAHSKKEESTLKTLEGILAAARHGTGLVQQILAFSRKTKTELTPINLADVISEAVPIIERTIPKMISVDLHLDRDIRPVNADSNQIEQIVLNLASNAKDAMPQGGNLSLKLENVNFEQDRKDAPAEDIIGDYVLLSVSDTGVGIDEKTLEHIFDPFFTRKDVGRGTGLGLASVYGIVMNHKGRITCESEPGKGSVFKIFLPALAGEIELVKTAKSKDLEVRGGHETVLFVDDEKALREIGKNILSSSGYKVVTAENGEKALELFKKKQADFDMIILDVSMPGMGGDKCLKELVKLDPNVKVLIATGYALGKELSETLSAGAAGYIAKPFNMNNLLRKVREVLDKK